MHKCIHELLMLPTRRYDGNTFNYMQKLINKPHMLAIFSTLACMCACMGICLQNSSVRCARVAYAVLHACMGSCAPKNFAHACLEC